MSTSTDWERWNTHFSTSVDVEVCGVHLRIIQDPNSQHLGSTVWDASIVMAKFFEKNSRKGDFSRSQLRGKRVLELGAGMGLGGMALTLLGASVISTDVAAVLPLLNINYQNNMAPASLRNLCGDLAREAGSFTVAELDWEDRGTWVHVQGPFDFILAADCIYNEALTQHFLHTVLEFCGPRTTVIIANEVRSESVQQRFSELFAPHFTTKRVPSSKLDSIHQHPSIHVLQLKRRKVKLETQGRVLHRKTDRNDSKAGCVPGNGICPTQETVQPQSSDLPENRTLEASEGVTEASNRLGAPESITSDNHEDISGSVVDELRSLGLSDDKHKLLDGGG
eukprot:jgi/Botrbrau1/22027/Bobra.0024s0041.1